MRQRNILHEIGNDNYIDYKKVHTDVVVANLYTSTPKGSYKYGGIGRLFAYFYEFDESEIEPMFDNHWVIYIELYEKPYAIEELVNLIMKELQDNTFIKGPHFIEVKVTKNESELVKEVGRTAAKDSMNE